MSTLLNVIFMPASSFRASSLFSLCFLLMTRQAPLCSGVGSRPRARFFLRGWWWTEITFSAELHFVLCHALPLALTFTWLYTCERSNTSSLSTHVGHSILVAFLLAFGPLGGREREQVCVIWPCNVLVFTFPPASPVSLISLFLTSCTAFSHFAPSSPSPFLYHTLLPHLNPLLLQRIHPVPRNQHAAWWLLPLVSQLRYHISWLLRGCWGFFFPT